MTQMTDQYHASPPLPTIPSYQSNHHEISSYPVPPPRRSATLPSAQVAPPPPSAHPPAPVQDPVVEHHRSLVAYYWHYAQQGYSAPLTAIAGTEESSMQERARREAVDWARQCGMQIREVESQQPGSGVPAESASRTRTFSRPLPTAPIQSQTRETPPIPSASRPSSIVGFGGGRPLPSAPIVPNRSVSLANPPLPTILTATPPLRSVSEAQPRPPPLPPAMPSPSVSQAEEVTPSSQPRKRPLPAPPVPTSDTEKLSDQLRGISVSSLALGSVQQAPRVSIPTISFGEDPTGVVPAGPPPPPRPRSPSPSPTRPAVPTFTLNDDVPSVPDPSTSSTEIPSFAFSVDDVQDDYSIDPPHQQQQQQRAPPIHPRYDPSHPSHALYHPTSVASTAPPPPPFAVAAAPSSSSSSSSIGGVETGGTGTGTAAVVECSSCRQLIFGRVLLALSKAWHPGCFVCAEPGCREKLEVMEFEATPPEWEEDDEQEEEQEGGGGQGGRGGEESLKGKAWCMVHFEERFGLQCYHCHTPISSADYLAINDPSLPPHDDHDDDHDDSSSSSSSSRKKKKKKKTTIRYYHPLHFFCAGCGDPFLDPVAYERSGETNAREYYVRRGFAYCEACDLRMWRDKCPGCRVGLREEDGYVEVGVEHDDEGGGGGKKKKKWHQGCFKCSKCLKPLDGIYLLRSEPCPSSSTTTTTRTSTRDCATTIVENPYCGECFDIVAKEEASAKLS